MQSFSEKKGVCLTCRMQPSADRSVPCDHVGLLGGDGRDLRSELVPLGDVAVGVGQVADVEDDVVVVQILDQRVRRVQRPRLVVRELVRSVPLRLPRGSEL